MTSRDFCYWLQGFFEVAKPNTMTAEQISMVQKHLSLVFVHEIDPSAGPPEHQAKLDAAHPISHGVGTTNVKFRC